MNDANFRTNWVQMRTRVKTWWTKLTDKDLDTVDGDREAFVALIQEKYLFSRAHAEDDVRRFMLTVATPEPVAADISFPGVATAARG